MKQALRTYRAKRDFKTTAEPRGRASKGAGKGKAPLFVIQKHDASRLHYDFRLELDGTLKSWAVPKGIPLAKGGKHLAVQVEDHPVEYANFEGVIPKGQYGGGTVMVWDTGTWQPLGGDPATDLAAGKLHFRLHGRKLDGEWTLLRMHRGEEKNWLLLKSGEDTRPISSRKDDESALSRRNMARIAKDRDKVWNSNAAGKQSSANSAPSSNHAPDFIQPMKATLVANPPAETGWLYELKFDGYRAQAIKSGSSVQLLSGNNKDFTKRFPEIAEAVAALSAQSVILDGEIVALDKQGRSSFQLLQDIENHRPPLAYYVFDLLWQDGQSRVKLPLAARRTLLNALLRKAPEPIRESSEIKGDPKKLLAEVKRRGLEGIMGKKRDSLYESGRRSRAWIKLKCAAEQELVIGGFTAPEGTRKHFGALLVGYYEGKKFLFAGKAGTGFDTALLKSLHAKMLKLLQKKCPFANLPAKEQGRWRQNITPSEMKRCAWIKPQLVCELRFTEWTRDGKLRHPVFLGLREDKAAKEVTRERPL